MLHHVEPKFIICDIWNLPLHLENNTFDVINLSNILDYFIDDSEQKSDDLMVFLTSLAKNVSRYGKILYYSYSPLGYEQGMVPCASRSTTFERIKTLEIFDVHRTYFQGMKKLGNDHVSWLQKK